MTHKHRWERTGAETIDEERGFVVQVECRSCKECCWHALDDPKHNGCSCIDS